MFCFFKSICRSLVPRGIVDGSSHGSAYWWRIIGRPFGRPHNQLWDEDLFVDLLRSKEVLSSDHIHILFTIQKMQLFHSQVLSFHSLCLCFAYLNFTINLNVTIHHSTWFHWSSSTCHWNGYFPPSTGLTYTGCRQLQGKHAYLTYSPCSLHT